MKIEYILNLRGICNNDYATQTSILQIFEHFYLIRRKTILNACACPSQILCGNTRYEVRQNSN